MSESHKKNLFAGLSKTLYQSELHKMHELHSTQSIIIIPVPPPVETGILETGI